MITDDLWRSIQEQARHHKISASQYVREAVIATVFYERGMSGQPGPVRKRQ